MRIYLSKAVSDGWPFNTTLGGWGFLIITLVYYPPLNPKPKTPKPYARYYLHPRSGAFGGERERERYKMVSAARTSIQVCFLRLPEDVTSPQKALGFSLESLVSRFQGLELRFSVCHGFLLQDRRFVRSINFVSCREVSFGGRATCLVLTDLL